MDAFPKDVDPELSPNILTEAASLLPLDHFQRLLKHAYNTTRSGKHSQPEADLVDETVLSAAGTKRVFGEMCSLLAQMGRASEGGRRAFLGGIGSALGEGYREVVEEVVSGCGVMVSRPVPTVAELVDVDWRVDYNLRSSKQTLDVLDHQVLVKVCTVQGDLQMACGVAVLEDVLDKVNDAILQIEEAKLV